jgi:sugar transferase (PEP-CTERM system associated)
LKIFNHHVSRTTVVLFWVEASVLLVSFYLGAAIRFFDSDFPFSPKFDHYYLLAAVFALVMLFSMSVFGMYKHNYREDIRNILLRLMPSFVLGFGILTSIFYLIPALDFGRGVLALVIFVAASLILLVRIAFYKTYEFNLLESRIVILGCGALAKECADLAVNHIGHHQYDVVGFVQMPNETCQVAPDRILPGADNLTLLVEKYRANEIIVAVNNRRDGAFPIQALLECKLNGTKVTDAASFLEREASQIRVDTLQPSWLVFGGGFDQSFLRAFVKRLFDLFSSAIILIVTLPLMLITALAIYIEDRSPIFYRQERVGRNGHSFMVLKFRSMRNDAEQGINPQWAAANDPRTTRVGRIIRKLRIDELPQIFNVFKGDMSFVGPRPERPFFVKQLCEDIPFYNVRHSIKPGITGLAQVRYQYGASVEDAINKLEYDLYYVKNNSLFLDALILIDTFQVVVLGKGQ